MSLAVLERSLIQQITEIVELPSSFKVYATALVDPIEQGIIISDELIWVVFEGMDLMSSKTTPPTSTSSIKYGVYIGVKDTSCGLQHHSAMQYLTLLLKSLYNTVPQCLENIFALTGTGWLINSVQFVQKWESNHYVYKLGIVLPVLLNIETCGTYTGVLPDEGCGEDNPFDPNCYIDYENQLLICPDGVKPLPKIKIGLWRNAVNKLGDNIVKDL